jgi:hypothetical protein
MRARCQIAIAGRVGEQESLGLAGTSAVLPRGLYRLEGLQLRMRWRIDYNAHRPHSFLGKLCAERVRDARSGVTGPLRQRKSKDNRGSSRGHAFESPQSR